MRRRALFAGAASLAIAGMLPMSEVAEVERAWSSPDVTFAIDWYGRLKALGYDLRRQYVANLRALGDERLTRIADLIEEINERPGGFAEI